MNPPELTAEFGRTSCSVGESGYFRDVVLGQRLCEMVFHVGIGRNKVEIRLLHRIGSMVIKFLSASGSIIRLWSSGALPSSGYAWCRSKMGTCESCRMRLRDCRAPIVAELKREGRGRAP